MKKRRCLALVLSMIICISACGKQNSVDDNMAGLTASETEQNVILLEDESRETSMEENIEGKAF